jgi:zinc protease
MIEFQREVLSNGLTVLVHEDHQTELVAVNLLYKVGARNESSSRTGFAHLFEHLMFGGSKNIPDFDRPLQLAGGSNNAFTTNDYTNYYITLPHKNLETALWLESDRMLGLSFSEESLEVQRKVVIEEFKQRYLNQPYGDVWLNLRPLAFKDHPYKWATIGKEISHIEEATLDDVKDFFYKYYIPNNAILVIAGNVRGTDTFKLVEKWFGEIPSGTSVENNFPPEPMPSKPETLSLEREVPQSAHYFAWHMPGRLSTHYPEIDLISDILGRGQSSRLHKKLVKDQGLFTSASSYILGSVDPGLFVVSGMLSADTNFELSKRKILEEVNRVCDEPIGDKELQKIKNNYLATHTLEQVSILNRAMNLAYNEFLGDAHIVNTLPSQYAEVSVNSIAEAAKSVFENGNYKELRYASKSKAV